jgi:hypothetical protein
MQGSLLGLVPDAVMSTVLSFCDEPAILGRLLRTSKHHDNAQWGYAKCYKALLCERWGLRKALLPKGDEEARETLAWLEAEASALIRNSMRRAIDAIHRPPPPRPLLWRRPPVVLPGASPA